ncbi:MAG: T9SS type A sorting domain-containing protein [Fibrobacteria bacterium]|nr:T9SS type A sorting domain-containing protein [Fibrobacteria bacterium]
MINKTLIGIIFIIGLWSNTLAQLVPDLLNWDGSYDDLITLPPLLSQTGFDPAQTNVFVPYKVNVPQYKNLMYAKRYVSVPAGTTIIPGDSLNYQYPVGTTFIREIFMDREYGNPSTQIKVEVQMQIRTTQEKWARVNYSYTAGSSDAMLIDGYYGYVDTVYSINVKGKNLPYATTTGTTVEKVSFPYFRLAGDCEQCHWDSSPNGFITQQLNMENQLQTLVDKKVLSAVPDVNQIQAKGMVVDWKEKKDTAASLYKRVLSYLGANCGHCHSSMQERFISGKVSELEYFRHPSSPIPPFMVNDTLESEILFKIGRPDSSMAIMRMLDGTMPAGEVSLPDVIGIKMMWDWVNGLDNNAANDVPWEDVVLSTKDVSKNSSQRRFSASYDNGLIRLNGTRSIKSPVSLYSIKGRNIQVQKLPNGNFSVTEKLSPGVYFVKRDTDISLLSVY